MIFIYSCGLILAFGPWFSWWLVPILAGLVAFWRMRRLWRTLPQAFLGGAIGWLAPALWKDAANGSLLSTKIGQLFHTPGPWGTLVVTGVLAGLLACLGAFMGQRLRRILGAFSEK